ncbi:MAG: hypothetical protein IIW61_00255 [Bacteroidaceae bacterium]|nr:hypothetical protein [Bacteroidaceae bacterium]
MRKNILKDATLNIKTNNLLHHLPHPTLALPLPLFTNQQFAGKRRSENAKNLQGV